MPSPRLFRTPEAIGDLDAICYHIARDNLPAEDQWPRHDPLASLHDERRRKMAAARHRRRETNLKLRQPTLPLECGEGVANAGLEMSHCG